MSIIKNLMESIPLILLTNTVNAFKELSTKKVKQMHLNLQLSGLNTKEN